MKIYLGKSHIGFVLSGLLLVAANAVSDSSPQIRLTPAEVDALPAHDAGVGTSGVAGIRTVVVAGDPTKPGSYTIRLSVPANTKIQAHTHRDDRTAVVVSGIWYFGYGNVANDSAVKSLPAGSFYIEPAGVAHFAQTRAEPVLVYITGNGPSDTIYVGVK
jgi:quercetin dioxygenase-like cupin family protein